MQSCQNHGGSEWGTAKTLLTSMPRGRQAANHSLIPSVSTATRSPPSANQLHHEIHDLSGHVDRPDRDGTSEPTLHLVELQGRSFKVAPVEAARHRDHVDQLS